MRLIFALIVLFGAMPASAQTEDQLYGPGDLWFNRGLRPGIVWGSKIVIDDRPCCEAPSGAPATAQSDSAVVAGLRDRASRDGRVLRLRLDGGRTLRITDCDDQTGCPGDGINLHRLVAWWPTLRYYVVQVFLYEEQMAFLIREQDGFVVKVAAPPVLSPDGRFALAWDSSILSGPKMEVLDMGSDPPAIRKITPMPACQGRSEHALPGQNPVWLSNTEAAFDGSQFLAQNSPQFRMTLRIVPNVYARWQCHL